MKRPDIYFAADDAHAFLPWVIGVMACMATLLLCLGLTFSGWIVDRNASVSNSFTVNIPAATDDKDAKAVKMISALRTTSGVTGVERLSDDALKDMLSSWIGSGETTADLPLPAVLDVATDGITAIDYKKLQGQLSSIAPGTEVDAHERWVESFAHFSLATRWILTTLAAVIIGSLALMVAFTSRASLKLHARTVSLLHSIGAEDNYITRQFQREAFLLSMRGTVPGALAAGLGYWAAGRYATGLQSTLLPSLSMSNAHWTLLVLMPLCCAIVACLAARFAIVRQLQHVL